MDVYCDLCIEEGPQTSAILERLFSYQVHLVCVNRTIDLSQLVPSESKSISTASKNVKNDIRIKVAKQMQPMNLSQYNQTSLGKYARVHGANAKILSRLTVAFTEMEDIKWFYCTFKKQLSNFEIVASCPGSEGAFHHSCTSMTDIDVIQLDTSVKPSYRLSAQMVRKAKSAGLFFEIQLAPMLNSSSGRSYTVSLAQTFMDITKGRGLVFSSGARSVWDVRNHIGLISVAAMLGVRPDLAPHCVRDNPKAALKHGLTRARTIYGAMAITKLEKMPGVKSVSCVQSSNQMRSQTLPKPNTSMKGFIDLDKSSEPPYKKQKMQNYYG